MLLTTQQSYELLAKHGCYITEICDACGRGIGPVRYTRRGDSGVWCSRECRGDGERQATRKNGRPRKYRNGEESRAAKTKQQRDYRLSLGVEKTVCIQSETKDLQAQKSPLSTTPLTSHHLARKMAPSAFGGLRLSLLALLYFFLASSTFAQGSMVPPQTALSTVNGITRPIANATITVCAANASGIPCSPALVNAIFSNIALTQPLTNPFFADANGNYIFAIAPGTYTVTVTASGFAGNSYQITVSAATATNVANTWTAPQTFSAQIVSNVATGTAPFSISSTTQVSNLNAQLHGGLSAPASAILGLTDTQSPTNKTFDISLNTFKNSSNTAGHYPRNNGTQYVDSTIQGADVPAINLAVSGNGGVTGVLPGANMAATNLAASGNGGVTGVLPPANEGTGTPGAGKYVDGATGAWTALPAGGIAVTAANQTGLQANVSATTLLTPGANGFYRATCYITATTLGGGSSTAPDCRVSYTDADSNTANVAVISSTITVAALGGVGTTVVGGATYPFGFYAKSGVAIQYQTTSYGSTGVPTFTYALHFRLEGPY